MAEYSANKLWAEVFPSISASVGANYSKPLFSQAGSWSLGTSANLGLNLTLSAGIPFAMKNIRLAYEARLLGYEDARNQLELQITKNFYGLIADRDNLSVLTDVMNLAELQFERDTVAFNNGIIGELSLLNSRLALANARFSLSGAMSTYANRIGDFLALLGLTQYSEAELSGEIAISRVELDAERLIMENLFRRPDIIGRRRDIERLENAEKQTLYSTRAPSLKLDASWSSRSLVKPFADSLSGGATLSIPIDSWIPGTRPSQSVRNSGLAVEQAKLDLQSTETSAAAQVRTLAANLGNLWDSIEIARLSVSVAERGYELTDLGFRNGTVDSLRLEDARNNLANAKQRLLQSELLYLNMILDISAALNVSWKELME
jgi:multidrug efflux system outer membrane protein